MYLNDKQIRLILFAPLLLKNVIENDQAGLKDNSNLTIEDEEAVNQDTVFINNTIKEAEQFVNDFQKQLGIDNKKFAKLFKSVFITINECYKMFQEIIDDKVVYKVPKTITSIVLSYWYFCLDIAENTEVGWIIKDDKYCFFQDYINQSLAFIEPLKIMGQNTLDFTTEELAKKGKKFNEDKFYRQCNSKVENIINLLKNI